MPDTPAQLSRSRAKDTRPPATGADEKAVLRGFLDYLRDAVAAKIADVPEPQVRTARVPSGTNLLGLVTHLTAVERFSFLGEDVADWGSTMRPSARATVDEVLADYRKAVADANRVIEACPDLTLPAPRPARRGPAPSMRWILVHMIEETGRHAGHVDILREQIDGATGR
ncbi:DinB family protein [Streptomyces sp. SID14478]|uniref:DinB family protein n=1 Tax=Streptomyces sp. SID14478 TaxID=2706073 RepID=UPI0013DC8838|nr:DinB family protein [Streptomyces sp. SID14478]NEB78321.1 DinB family protein [Streptomyces sp. SID14478]